MSSAEGALRTLGMFVVPHVWATLAPVSCVAPEKREAVGARWPRRELARRGRCTILGDDERVDQMDAGDGAR